MMVSLDVTLKGFENVVSNSCNTLKERGIFFRSGILLLLVEKIVAQLMEFVLTC